MNREIFFTKRILQLEGELDAAIKERDIQNALNDAVCAEIPEEFSERFETPAERVKHLVSSYESQRQRITVTETLRDDYYNQLTDTREKLAAYEAEAAKLRALTPEGVLEAQALLERLLAAAFGEDKTEPVKALETLKAYMGRQRRSILAARRAVGKLMQPVPMCGCCPGADKHEAECNFLIWVDRSKPMLRHHGLVDAPKPDAEEAGE